MTDEKPGTSDTLPEGESENTDKNALNTLLASWDETGKKPPEQPSNEGLAKELAHVSYELEMQKVVPRLKGEHEVTDNFVSIYVNSRANGNAKLLSLWDNRHDNRAEFDAAIDAMKDDFDTYVADNGMGSKAKSDDTPADDSGLAAAAHIARETPAGGNDLDTLDFSSMSDQDFAFRKQEIFRLAEAGQLK